MANPTKRVLQNMPGDFFVDETCIDCDACRQIAPSVFGEATESSFVKHQPTTIDEKRQALCALLSCPTGSIGCLSDDDPKSVMDDFPIQVEGPVFYCGFNSPKSFGGNSYFIQHPDGNWLIDSPKYLAPLVRKFESLGGINHIFLTHRDDVADAEKYAARFNARRIIHRDELSSQPDAEVVLDGNDALQLWPGFVAIPTPGHTKGHCALLFDERFLFTGDHLDWNRHEQRLDASRDYCWYSWREQIESIQRLTQFHFEWILPGHGQKIYLPANEMKQQVMTLVEHMRNEL